jgi:hypothetical protein
VGRDVVVRARDDRLIRKIADAIEREAGLADAYASGAILESKRMLMR